MELISYFNDMLAEIRLKEEMRQACIDGHSTLRERLDDNDNLKEIIVSTFLQGSYRRSTQIRPYDDQRADVDIVVATNLDPEEWTPIQVQDLFCRFLG